MKTTWMKLTLLTALATTFATADGDTPPGSHSVSARLLAGRGSLEGPAITGPDESRADEFEESENGAGLQLEFDYALRRGLFLRSMAEWMSYGSDPGFDLSRLSLGLGLRRGLGEAAGMTWEGYGILSVEYARTSGLSGFANNPKFGGEGTGKSGDDTGLGLEGGVIGHLGDQWSFLLYGKYYSFGDGSGPGFGFRADYALSDSWSVTGGWEGMWVEDAGYQIDLDFQRATLGLRYRF